MTVATAKKNKKKKVREKVTCLRPSCGYKWTPKVDTPAQCPLCKQYDWNDSKHLGGNGEKT